MLTFNPLSGRSAKINQGGSSPSFALIFQEGIGDLASGFDIHSLRCAENVQSSHILTLLDSTRH